MQRFRAGLILVAVNAAVTVGLLTLWTAHPATSAATPGVIEAQGIRLVDAQGRVRGELKVEEDGSAYLKLKDGNGQIRVKLGSSVTGASGLLLLNESVEPAVQILGGRETTRITLQQDGRPARELRP